MAFEQELNAAGAPGLIFPCVAHSIETGCMADTIDSEGGFSVFGKTGEAGKVYSVKPEGGYFLGVAVRTMIKDTYAAGDLVSVLKKGRVWVRVLAAVQAGDAAYVDDTNGSFTNVSAGATQIVGGTFKSNAAENELAELEIA